MMKPFTINGDVWRVVRVEPGNPSLIDKTGTYRLATTDPDTKEVYISDTLKPPLLDKVLLHEVAHAVAISYGLLDTPRLFVSEEFLDMMEEWGVQLVENYGIEAADAASMSLGRPICIGGYCHD